MPFQFNVYFIVILESLGKTWLYMQSLEKLINHIIGLHFIYLIQTRSTNDL